MRRCFSEKYDGTMARIATYCRMKPGEVVVDGRPLEIVQPEGVQWLTSVYRSCGVSYPKFFKMDNLCKAGFLASELVLAEAGARDEEPKCDVAVVFMNRASSLDDDIAYQQTIRSGGEFYPSPSVFVYTLANIVTGEVAIRNRIYGETSFYVAERFSAGVLVRAVEGVFTDPSVRRVLCGWVDWLGGVPDVLVMMAERDGDDFDEQNINKLY